MSSLADLPDPTALYRIRDGVYAADLLIVAVATLDLFTWLEARGPVQASELVEQMGLVDRPVDVLLTYCTALGLINRDVVDKDRIEITDLARQHLVAGSAYDLRPYYSSLAERPTVAELERVLGGHHRRYVHRSLPGGYDVHLYSQVLHDWDAERVEQLLTSSFAALPPGGWLIDHDTHIAADKRGPLPVAEYSVLLMHTTPGKCWSTSELTDIAHTIGFVDITHRPAGGDRGAFLAHKPN
jgi:hypothetical protein